MGEQVEKKKKRLKECFTIPHLHFQLATSLSIPTWLLKDVSGFSSEKDNQATTMRNLLQSDSDQVELDAR